MAGMAVPTLQRLTLSLAAIQERTDSPGTEGSRSCCSRDLNGRERAM